MHSVWLRTHGLRTTCLTSAQQTRTFPLTPHWSPDLESCDQVSVFPLFDHERTTSMTRKVSSAPVPAIRDTRATLLRRQLIAEHVRAQSRRAQQAQERLQRAETRERRRKEPVQDLPPASAEMPIPFTRGLHITPERNVAEAREATRNTGEANSRGTQEGQRAEISSSVHILGRTGEIAPTDTPSESVDPSVEVARQRGSMGTQPSREETGTGVQNPSVSAIQGGSEHIEPTQPLEVAQGSASTSRVGNGASYAQQSMSRPATQLERALVTIQESHVSSRLST